jgi:CBS domain-containing protein
MRAEDVMSQPVISIAHNASVLDAVELMLQHKISGLPVVDGTERLVGIVTEGDFLRRAETGTQRRRPRWIEFLLGPGKLATEYVHASGRKIDEVMTPDVHAVQADAPVEDVVRVMERHGVKRVPVLRGEKLVGIIARANLMRAVASAARAELSATKADRSISADDAAIRARLMAELAKQPWAPLGTIEAEVHDGVVTLSGTLTDERQRQALCVAAENVPGVKKVEDQLIWVVPGTGIVGEPAVIVGPPER